LDDSLADINGFAGRSHAALTVFVQDSGLQFGTARAVKQYGGGHEAPPGATVHFRGNDPQDGPISGTPSSPERYAGLLEHRPVRASHCHQFILALHEKL